VFTIILPINTSSWIGQFFGFFSCFPAVFRILDEFQDFTATYLLSEKKTKEAI